MEEDEEVGLPPAMLQPQQIGMVLPLTSRPISDINNMETFSALTLLGGVAGRASGLYTYISSHKNVI